MRCVNCCVGVNTVATVWLFMGIKFMWISLGFLSVKIYSYAWCLRYNICSTWFLDIRISTCCHIFQLNAISGVFEWRQGFSLWDAFGALFSSIDSKILYIRKLKYFLNQAHA